MTPEFFTLHSDLPREGPGEPEDVFWAVGQAGTQSHARLCDAGCGPGSDIAALLEAIPDSHLTAVDAHADFIEAVAGRFDSTRVDARQGDMLALTGPFDLIWSAGAVYNVGVADALRAWRMALAPGGHVAFSHPAWFTDNPSAGARAFWQGYDGVLTEAGLTAVVEDASYRMVAAKRISDAAWEAYLGPLDVRIAGLRPDADAAMNKVLDEAEEEARLWRAHRGETGYRLAVVRPA